MSTATFTLVHVVLSLIGIASGLIVAWGLLLSKRLEGWTALFLATTILTSATGYLFRVDRVLPSHIVGAISLIVLMAAVFARYQYRMAGAWRWIYVVTALIALYLNVFVAIVQSFLKISALNALAPQQSEPPFIIAQAAFLIAFIVIGFLCIKRFHPPTTALRPA